MCGSFNLVMKLPGDVTSKHWAVCLFVVGVAFEFNHQLTPDIQPSERRLTQLIAFLGALILWYISPPPKP